MPLKCTKCGATFEVRLNSEYEASRFQEKLWNHCQDLHPGEAANYQLVDEKGITASQSTSEKVKEEEKQLNKKVTEWIN